MKFSLLLTGLLSLFATTSSAQSLQNLEPFEWSNRLVLIHAAAQKVDALEKQLVTHDTDIRERHIIWFILSQQQVRTNYSGKINSSFYSRIMQDWFSQAHLPLEVLLIGKDGTEKWRNQTLDLPAIFAEIDVMPMRRYEMRNQ